MDYINKHKYLFLFSLGLIIFVVYQCNFLSTPYFWDELGVYIPAARQMNDAGTISLLPSSLDPLYSRGHPLLYTFCNAAIFHIFGESVIVAHGFALFLAIVFLGSFYYIVCDLFEARIAFYACILFAIQPVFMAMSVISLPEMLLAIFTTWSLWSLIRSKWYLYSLFGSLAIMTKESAIVVLGIAFLYFMINWVLKFPYFSRDKQLKIFICISIPLLVYVLFLCIQKIQNGWFFFPEHIGYLHLSLMQFFNTNVRMIKTFFLNKSNFLVGIPAIIYLAMVLINWKRASNVYMMMALFIVAAFLFSNFNFYLPRYLLFVVPWIILFGVTGIDKFINKYFAEKPGYQYFVGLYLLGACACAVNHWDNDRFNDTFDVSYRKVVNLVKETTDWVSNQPWKNKPIEANFPVFQALQESRNGYVSKPYFISVNFQWPCEYGVFYRMKGEELFKMPHNGYYVKRLFDAAIGFHKTSENDSYYAIKSENLLRKKIEYEVIKIFYNEFAEVQVVKFL
jgi:hypothetical protein